MTAYRLDRRAALGLAAGSLLSPLVRPARAQSLDKLIFQTDWRAQAEHGGYYQALAAGLYRKAGIDCEIRQGGPSLNIGQLLFRTLSCVGTGQRAPWDREAIWYRLMVMAREFNITVDYADFTLDQAPEAWALQLSGAHAKITAKVR